jgi:hypothetical protein
VDPFVLDVSSLPATPDYRFPPAARSPHPGKQRLRRGFAAATHGYMTEMTKTAVLVVDMLNAYRHEDCRRLRRG